MPIVGKTWSAATRRKFKATIERKKAAAIKGKDANIREHKPGYGFLKKQVDVYPIPAIIFKFNGKYGIRLEGDNEEKTFTNVPFIDFGEI